LSAAAFSFKFPEPGYLDGVKSKDKAILKMTNINFTYPGASRQAIFNVSLQCSLNSRVAVIGPNGAGKSIDLMGRKIYCYQGLNGRSPP
jgi:elongation factor 3